MYFQAPAVQLLDTIYHAAHDRMTILDPRHAQNSYLKILLEPLSPEARVWANSAFENFGNHVCYEIFRPLDEAQDVDLRLRGLYYQKTSLAIAQLMIANSPATADPPRSDVSAQRLHVAFQQPRKLGDFLNIYVAIAGISEAANNASLQATIKAVQQLFTHYNPYYYIDNVT